MTPDVMIANSVTGLSLGAIFLVLGWPICFLYFFVVKRPNILDPGGRSILIQSCKELILSWLIYFVSGPILLLALVAFLSPLVLILIATMLSKFGLLNEDQIVSAGAMLFISWYIISFFLAVRSNAREAIQRR